MPRSHTFRPGDTVRIRDERWRVIRYVPFSAAALIDVAGVGSSNRSARATFLLPFEPIERQDASSTPRRVGPSAWRAIARRAIAAATPSPHAFREAWRARLDVVPFQLEPALALIAGRATRVLLADEVGLGKTIQAGLAMAEVMAREPDARALVVCPAGLRDQWQGELRDRFSLTPVVLDAAGIAQRSAAFGAGINPWAADRLVIASVDYIKRPEVIRALESLIWDIVIFDEAHALAGVSDRTSAATSLAQRARRVLLLTATPHSGDEEAFRRMCGIGRLDGDRPLLVFRRDRAAAGLPGRRRSMVLRVAPSPAEEAMHAALASYARRVRADAARLAIGVLMRRACSSPASLARSLERRIAWIAGQASEGAQIALPFDDCEAGDDEPSAVLAVRGLDDAAEELRILERLLALAQRASTGERKVAALLRLLRRAGEPALVFTEYRDTLEHLASRLPCRTALLHGGMTPRLRRASLDAFDGGSIDVLLATDAASEGLNLHQRCRLVINLELPWTPLRLEQRIGRVDRIGQSRTVHAVQLVARATAEEEISQRLSARAARAVVSLEESARGGVSAEAASEADRLRLAHRLMKRTPSGLSGAGDEANARPAHCILKRTRKRSRGGLWAWMLTFEDAEGRLVWESLLAVRADVAGAGAEEAVSRVAADEAARRLALLLAETSPAVARLAMREASIAQALRERQARLAASFLQRGLFDRRAERTGTAQAAVLQDALARSAAHLRVLTLAKHPQLHERRLVFKLMVE